MPEGLQTLETEIHLCLGIGNDVDVRARSLEHGLDYCFAGSAGVCDSI